MTNDAFRVLNRSLYSSFKHILLAKFRLTTVIAYDYLVWVFSLQNYLQSSSSKTRGPHLVVIY